MSFNVFFIIALCILALATVVACRDVNKRAKRRKTIEEEYWAELWNQFPPGTYQWWDHLTKHPDYGEFTEACRRCGEQYYPDYFTHYARLCEKCREELKSCGG